MHGEQAGGVIHGEFPAGSGLNVKMGRSRTFFIKQIDTGWCRVFWLGQRVCRQTSADQLHVHSSDCASWWDRSHPVWILTLNDLRLRSAGMTEQATRK